MEETWLTCNSVETEFIEENLIEVKLNFLAADAYLGTKVTLQCLLTYFSSLISLQRSIAWLTRFKQFLRSKLPNSTVSPPDSGFLLVEELEAALVVIVKLAQQDSLASELEYFKCNTSHGPPSPEVTNKELKSPFASALLKCSPFVKDGVLRVGGRLHHSELSESQKHPIILAPDHHVTKLIVDWYHCENGHAGTLHVLAAVRQKFWILRGQAAVSKIIRGCVPCKIRSAPRGGRWMSDLPAVRVTPGNRPFHSTFVDLFGPIKVKVGRSECKRYGVIFCCMVTRAVHIEVSETLETSAFLEAYFRFASRRSYPAHMYSDNGSNFTGAEKELARGIANWNAKIIDKTLSQKGTQWHFSPPLASHQSGVIERLVRSAKTVFYSVSVGKTLTDYSLWSLLVGVEMILNSRPLTAVSDDPRDLNILTPNSIL